MMGTRRVDISRKDAVKVVEECLDNQVLLHHVERQVVGRRCRPHERRAEDNGQIGDVHAVRVAVLGNVEQVAEEEVQRVVVLSRQRINNLCNKSNNIRPFNHFTFINILKSATVDYRQQPSQIYSTDLCICERVPISSCRRWPLERRVQRADKG